MSPTARTVYRCATALLCTLVAITLLVPIGRAAGWL